MLRVTGEKLYHNAISKGKPYSVPRIKKVQNFHRILQHQVGRDLKDNLVQTFLFEAFVKKLLTSFSVGSGPILNVGNKIDLIYGPKVKHTKKQTHVLKTRSENSGLKGPAKHSDGTVHRER